MNYKQAEERWKGKLGEDYVKRNKKLWQSAEKRKKFWDNIIDKYKLWEDGKRILEVGCGDGKNLFNIPQSFGIDINFDAMWEAKEGSPSMNIIEGSVIDIPFKDNYFDLVFTCGLLIHIPPDGILKAMKEIVRCSRRYILAIEYWSEKERERPFLGEMGITWERPWAGLFLNNFNVRLLEQGFLTKKDGFNDLQYFMFQKEK